MRQEVQKIHPGHGLAANAPPGACNEDVDPVKEKEIQKQHDGRISGQKRIPVNAGRKHPAAILAEKKKKL